jgi:hypothetical protein
MVTTGTQTGVPHATGRWRRTTCPARHRVWCQPLVHLHECACPSARSCARTPPVRHRTPAPDETPAEPEDTSDPPDSDHRCGGPLPSRNACPQRASCALSVCAQSRHPHAETQSRRTVSSRGLSYALLCSFGCLSMRTGSSQCTTTSSCTHGDSEKHRFHLLKREGPPCSISRSAFACPRTPPAPAGCLDRGAWNTPGGRAVHHGPPHRPDRTKGVASDTCVVSGCFPRRCDPTGCLFPALSFQKVQTERFPPDPHCGSPDKHFSSYPEEVLIWLLRLLRSPELIERES